MSSNLDFYQLWKLLKIDRLNRLKYYNCLIFIKQNVQYMI